MLMTIHTPTLHPEAAVAASVSPCWQSFDQKPQLGRVLALAGRYVR